MDNEIVVVMTAADWNRLLTILQDAYLKERKQANADKIGDLVKRLAHRADKLTLGWFDRKLAEFP